MENRHGHTAATSRLRVVYVPMRNTVATLDTSGPDWVMHLDSDSPPEDHIWALMEALHIVTHGGNAVGTGAESRHLRLVPGPPRAR